MNIKKTATVIAAAFALALGGATAANAYVPAPQGGTTVTLAPGGTGTYTFQNFVPGEVVTFSLTGESANSATLAAASARTAVETKTANKTASASGEAAVAVTLPSNASGTYTLSATGADSGTASSSITISVAASGGGLPNTGADVSPVIVWGAVGAVGLGAIGLVAATAVRRSRVAEKA